MLRALLITALLAISLAANAGTTLTLANGAATTGAQTAQALPCGTGVSCGRTIACNMTVASGSGTATVLVQGSLDPAHSFWVTLATLSTITETVSAATTDTSKFTAYRANVSAITGTTAKVYCYGGT